MNPALRVLHVYSGNLYGGIEAFLSTLARNAALCPEMTSEFALCFRGRLAQELERAGATSHDLGEVRTREPWSVVRARRRLRTVARSGRFDAVVCHSPWAQAMFGGVAPEIAMPAVFWLHEAVAGKHWLERWARRHRPSLCVANSHFTKSTLATLFPNVPRRVVYCPVEQASVKLSDRERRELRHEHGADEGTTVIVQASRMQPLKGHRRLLRALARLPRPVRWLCLQLGGPQRTEERQYFDELRALASRLGISDRVRFLGQRSDVARLFAASDVYCQPNTMPDSFGIAFIEALSAGLAVVSADLGGPREIVSPEVGFLVGDDDVLRQALERLSVDVELRRCMRAAGPERARRLCDVEQRLADVSVAVRESLRAYRATGRPQ